MARLRGRYDVIDLGETQDFWSGVSDKLDKYLDPEFQRKLKIDKEEQRRYEEGITREDAQIKKQDERYNTEQERLIEEKERQLKLEEEARIKSDEEYHRTQLEDDMRIAREQGMDDEYIAELIDAERWNINEDTGNLRTGIDPYKLELRHEGILRRKDFNTAFKNFTKDPSQESYNVLAELADTEQRRNLIRQNADPKLEKLKLKNQSVALTQLMNTHLKIGLKPEVLKQFTDLDKIGVDAAFGLFEREINSRQKDKDERVKLAKDLLELEVTDTMSDDEIKQISSMKLMGWKMLEKENLVPSPTKKTGGGNKAFDYSFDVNQIKNNDLVELDGQKLSGKKLKELLAGNNISDEELSKLKISRAGKIKKSSSPSLFSPRYYGSMVPQDEYKQEQVKIANKKEIDKEAKRLGWNDKIDPTSIKFQLIKEQLEKKFPNYNF